MPNDDTSPRRSGGKRGEIPPEAQAAAGTADENAASGRKGVRGPERMDLLESRLEGCETVQAQLWQACGGLAILLTLVIGALALLHWRSRAIAPATAAA